ncbi:pilus assembly protein TadG-related protein [Streptomyces sp. NPDC045431]|uniref:pilus assembly protein TadG-related protein n=1 Tax=Streptomyces sp. NPDC045431 TaxID=3155613 RepID=UPI0033DC8B1B
MTWVSARSESGQAAPLYITAVAGLLFLALVFFAFGQADVTRNGTQSAAEAAALAAAKESRDRFADDFLMSILDPDYLEAVFNGDVIGTANGCQAAGRYAVQNKAEMQECHWVSGGRWGFTVKVQSQDSMGTSIVEGTDNKHAVTQATALVEPRCAFERNDQGDKPDDGDVGEGAAQPVSPGELVCDGGTWDIDPENLKLLPDIADLFTVRLAKD